MLTEGQVRGLCEKVAGERDAKKAADLLQNIRQMIAMETDEARLRIRQILLHYRDQPGVVTAKPKSSIAQFVAAVLAEAGRDPSDSN
jgi:hypothetical protein